MSTALTAFEAPPTCADMNMAATAVGCVVGTVGLLATVVIGKKNERISQLEKQLEVAERHNEVADLQREVQLLREENEMLLEQLVDEQLKATVAGLSDSDSAHSETSAPTNTTGLQEAVVEALRSNRHSAGSLRDMLKEAFPGVKKSDINSCLYKLRAKRKAGIVETHGSKPIWDLTH